MNVKPPKFPRAWTNQFHVEQEHDQVNPITIDPGLAFKTMLPDATGYISVNNTVVMYGEQYARLKAEGKIE